MGEPAIVGRCRGCATRLYGYLPDGLCLDCTWACIEWHHERGRDDLDEGVVSPEAVDGWLEQRAPTT